MTEVLLNNKWVKASVVGTVWAASEIVFGSFLHNLRIPFCGNILTAIGLIILISFAYTFKEKGIFWRAGLICALLKTLSPSAVIFGPMIAIFTEAVLLEIAVLILGRTYVGFIVGSVLAMAWNLVQKILSYILFYGLDMNLRAVLMILGFAVLAVELYNPKIRDFFRRSSFNQLPKALELSLESLPVFVSAVPDFKTAIRNPVKVFYSIVINASKRLEQYQNPSSKTPQIIILSGKIADGKTTLAKKAYEHLTNCGNNCGGFFSEKVFVNDVLVGYDVVDAVTHKREQILRVIECEECDRIGKYSVCEKGFLFGKQILENSFKMNELIIIDECGKMELEDKGWADSLKKINENPGKKFILTIRDINVNDFIEKYQWENYLVVDVKKTSVDEVCRMIGKR
ncbi:MAG: nucleoside-triphosphatase [Bacteroidales bacterium]|nr:nucleoside-triphosphatase [Bacteroidales bacterium]